MTVQMAAANVVAHGAAGFYPGCPETVDAALARGRILRRPRWGLWDVLIAFVGAIGLGFLVSLVLPAVTSDDPPAGQLLLAVTVPWLAMAGWPLLATTWRGNGPRIDLGLRLGWRDLGAGALGGVTAWAVLAAVALATVAVTGEFTSAAGEVAAELVRDGNRLWLLGFALAVGLGAPIVEEILFRGLFYDALRKRGVHDGWVVAVTAVAFAAVHFEPVRLPLLIAMGVITGVLRWKTRAIGAGIVAHAMVNLPGAILVAMGLPGGS
ncbi:MAG: lysostaphin resistance A-like protein [Actinomycetales bacterium]